MHIAYIGCSGIPYCDTGVAAAKAEAKAMGASETFVGTAGTPSSILAACQDTTSSGRYQAIVLMSNPPTASIPCAEGAAKYHIPLTTTFGPVGANYVKGGPTVAGVTSQVQYPLSRQIKAFVAMVPAACGSHRPCGVIWLRGEQTDPSVDALAAKDVATLQKSDPYISFVGQADPENSDSESVTDTQQLTAAHPTATVILADNSAGGVGALKALGANPKHIEVLVTGCSAAQVSEIRAKTLYGCNLSLPNTETETATKLAIEAARGMKVPSWVNPLSVAKLPPSVDQANIAKFPQFHGQYQQ